MCGVLYVGAGVLVHVPCSPRCTDYPPEPCGPLARCTHSQASCADGHAAVSAWPAELLRAARCAGQVIAAGQDGTESPLTRAGEWWVRKMSSSLVHEPSLKRSGPCPTRPHRMALSVGRTSRQNVRFYAPFRKYIPWTPLPGRATESHRSPFQPACS